MIEVGMGVQDMADNKPHLLYLVENSFIGAAGIDHNSLLSDRIADDRTVASEGRHRERLSNQSGHGFGMLQRVRPSVQAHGQIPERHGQEALKHG